MEALDAIKRALTKSYFGRKWHHILCMEYMAEKKKIHYAVWDFYYLFSWNIYFLTNWECKQTTTNIKNEQISVQQFLAKMSMSTASWSIYFLGIFLSHNNFLIWDFFLVCRDSICLIVTNFDVGSIMVLPKPKNATKNQNKLRKFKTTIWPYNCLKFGI